MCGTAGGCTVLLLLLLLMDMLERKSDVQYLPQSSCSSTFARRQGREDGRQRTGRESKKRTRTGIACRSVAAAYMSSVWLASTLWGPPVCGEAVCCVYQAQGVMTC